MRQWFFIIIFRQTIAENEKILIQLNEKVKGLQEIQAECKIQFDAAQAKEKVLEKAFKKEFIDASPVVQEQALKLYK